MVPDKMCINMEVRIRNNAKVLVLAAVEIKGVAVATIEARVTAYIAWKLAL